MKDIPYFNQAPTCLMNCVIMALLHLRPWVSPDADGKTWQDPFSNSEWMDSFLKKLGITRRGTGGAGLEDWVCAQFLGENDLSSSLMNLFNSGLFNVRLIKEVMNWYDEAPFDLIASVEYTHLPGGRYGPHAVMLTEIKDQTITYHDPGLQKGAHIVCERKQFEKAMRLYNFKTFSYLNTGFNLMVIWDQDCVPDLKKALANLKMSKSQKRTVQIGPSSCSQFKIYRDPVKMFKRLIAKTE